MSHRDRKKSNYSQHTMRTHQTHKSVSRQSKRKRYPKRVHNPNATEPNHGQVIPANYRQSSLQIQDHHHTRSQYSHHSHSHSTFHERNYKQYRNNHDFLPDIQSDEDHFNPHQNVYNDTETSIPEDEYTDEYTNEYKQQHNRRRSHRNNHNNNHNNNNNNNNIQQILAAVRREYQQQVDHVISKWKELLDRAQNDVEKYRNIYHSERTHNKKLQQTIHQLRSKLKKYKNKDNENQMIIIDLQQRLNDVYENLTEITTPSYTTQYNHNRPKLPLVSPKKLLDSYYNYSRHSNNKTSLKTSLPPPTQTTHTTHSHTTYTKRRNSHSHISNSMHDDDVHQLVIDDDDDDDIILMDKHKIVKTRDDLKKILDTIENDNINNHTNSNHHEEHGKFISVIIKYKDKLFKNASNTIKVYQSINLNEFVSQLCDSININPQLIQLQHHTKIIDINEKKNMQSSLQQLDIDNFDNIFVYIDYKKLLNENNQHNQNQNEILKIFEQCMECVNENKVNNNAKNMLLLRKSIVELNEYCINLQEKEGLYSIITDCILQNNPSLMLKLLCEKISKIMSCQYVRLYFKWNNILQIIYPQNNLNIKQQIIIDLNNNNQNSNQNKSLLMEIMNEESEERDFDINCMKCCNDPSVDNNNNNNNNIDSTLISPLYFSNEEYIDKQLIGIIQLINKENKENKFEFTFHDKQLLFPFTKIFAIAMKILYHLSKQHKIFDAIHRNDNDEYNLFYNTRVSRGVSRALYKSQSNSISKDEHLNIITGDMAHNSISRNASPIYYNSNDNLSTTSSVHSQSQSHSTPIFAPMIASPPQIPTPYPIHKNQKNPNNQKNNIIHNENRITNVFRRRRNESEQYHHTFLINEDSDHHQQNSIVLNVSEFKQQQQDNLKTGARSSKSCSSESSVSNGIKNDNNNNYKNNSNSNSSNSDENDELLTPPTPTQNYITKESISV